MVSAIAVLKGTMNRMEVTESATWWPATTVSPSGLTSTATLAKELTSKKIASPMGRPRRAMRHTASRSGLRADCSSRLAAKCGDSMT